MRTGNGDCRYVVGVWRSVEGDCRSAQCDYRSIIGTEGLGIAVVLLLGDWRSI